MKEEDIRELLEECIFTFTEGDFFINKTINENCVIYSIEVDRSEYGKICGAKGKMIRSIKYIWETCISRSYGKAIRVILKEPSKGYSKGRQPKVPSENFKNEWFQFLLHCVADISCNSKPTIIHTEIDESLHFWEVSEIPNKNHLKHDYAEAFENLFTGIAKANGGNVELSFKWTN